MKRLPVKISKTIHSELKKKVVVANKNRKDSEQRITLEVFSDRIVSLGIKEYDRELKN